MSLTKHIVVFDEGIDVHDFGQVLVYVYAYAIGYSYYRRGELEV